jgi:hypothetical protein
MGMDLDTGGPGDMVWWACVMWFGKGGSMRLVGWLGGLLISWLGPSYSLDWLVILHLHLSVI